MTLGGVVAAFLGLLFTIHRANRAEFRQQVDNVADKISEDIRQQNDTLVARIDGINRTVTECKDRIGRAEDRHIELRDELYKNYPSGQSIDRLRGEIRSDFKEVMSELIRMSNEFARYAGEQETIRKLGSGN